MVVPFVSFELSKKPRLREKSKTRKSERLAPLIRGNLMIVDMTRFLQVAAKSASAPFGLVVDIFK